METDMDNPARLEVAGGVVQASVFSQTRMMVTDRSAKRLWFSPVLEREFLWNGELQLPRGLSNDERYPQTDDQREVEAFRLKHAAAREIVSRDPNRPSVKPTPDGGYGMLAIVESRKRAEKSVSGSYYLEVGSDGRLRREVHLEPLARRLGAKGFSDFLPLAQGEILLAGAGFVTRVGKTGVALWSLRLEAAHANVPGIVGTESNAWAFGLARDAERRQNLLWVERVDPNRAQPLPEAPDKPRALAYPTSRSR
jgi:hypothetical protein